MNGGNLKRKCLKQILHFSRKHTEDVNHARCVAEIALHLYDDLKKEHDLGRTERDLLYAAALLHDIGWEIGPGQHNKCGMRYILRDTKLPFTPHERVIVALVVRYHRGRVPRRCHGQYGDLKKKDRSVVRILSGILRIADGLDCSHSQVVKEVHAKISGDNLYLKCIISNCGNAEKKATKKKADLLIQVFSTELKIRWITG